MAPSSRPQYHLDLGHLPPLNLNQARSDASANSSPIEPLQNSNSRFAQSSTGSFGSLGNGGSTRLGSSSPSHEHGSRLFSRRAREIQASEGLGHQGWGPPTASGLSTPLRETIPESPGDDTFPDLNSASLDVPSRSSSIRRTRAGTVPSRFPAGVETGPSSAQNTQTTSTSRPTPSNSPFRSGTASVPEGSNTLGKTTPSSSFLSRFRAGSMPQHSSYSSPMSPFGPSVFSSNWNSGRERSGTFMSYVSDDPTSPTHLSHLKDSMADTDVKTLDYLGLVDPPQQTKPLENPAMYGNLGTGFALGTRPLKSDVNRMPSNRFRSYSVNATEKYADEDDMSPGSYYSGTLTPAAQSAAAALAATQAQIHKHNLDVQAFANQASSNRPRARTAGLLDSPSSRLWKTYIPAQSRLDGTFNAGESSLEHPNDYQSLANAVQALQLQNDAMQQELSANEEKSRALWLGSIPSSTTPSSLKVIFETFGKIESARVLTHKNCGFINFDNLESAIRAKSHLNGKEIFPGAGPVRIGYAKAPSASGTPGANGIVQSPSPDFAARMPGDNNNNEHDARGEMIERTVSDAQTSGKMIAPRLRDIGTQICSIVKEFGASEEEQARISANVEQAIQFDSYASDIPPMSEPSQSRLHDAPRLRDIRKRIDNNNCTLMEIEEIAMQMLPEIAELSSDYLGNTVVQKLFEFCSEPVKEAMLAEIAQHLAEIGIHKNGTWAAQKVIDVARTPKQMHMIVEHLRPYGVGLFLDQYGNYVMQCCLRFGAPWNNFIFECILCRIWQLSQGRFGARAMRACLESHHATKDQQRMVAATIALHSVQLATNANGALLLTWFLDTCTFPNRRKILAPRLISHLVNLCTHKVAYLTVLKIINQRNEPEARDLILNALFFSPDDEVLKDILKDQSCGATLIFKILTTPFLEEQMRSDVVQNVRKVLQQIKAQPGQGYKRLMEEVGLSTRNAGGSGRESMQSNRDSSAARSSSRQDSGSNSMTQTQAGSQQQTNGYAAAQAPPTYNTAPHFQQPQYNGGFDGQVYAPPNHQMPSPMTNQNHMQYQQAMLAPARPTPMYNYTAQSYVNGYASPMPQAIDPYRTMGRTQMTSPQPMPMASSPMMPQAGFTQPAYNPMMAPGGPGMWQYPPTYMVPPPQQMQAQGMMGGANGGPGGGGGGGGRRGRR